MFGFGRVAKVQKACVEALQPFVLRPAALGPWPPEFWRDPYVVGFLVYVMGAMMNLTSGGKLSTQDRGTVLIATLKEVGGYSPDFMDRVALFSEARDPDFMLGGRNAETVVTYVMNLHPMPGDPDVARATELAKGTTLTGSVGRDEIGGTLMHLLFADVVKKRLFK